MKIAIIGTGISGLTAAHYLHPNHDVTLYEANNYVGGHTNTVTVEDRGQPLRIDTGFIVFNDWTYPNFIRLLKELQVESQPTTMSFAVRDDRTGLEYNGNNLNTLFAQRRNLVRPQFWRMLADIVRFNRQARQWTNGRGADLTVGEFLWTHRYSRVFADQYLYPMGSAIWSCPPEKFERFPIRFIAEFYHNHGLLNLWQRPVWRVIQNGSQSYVERLIAPFRNRILLKHRVQSVERLPDGAVLRTRERGTELYDHVILACHSDQALRMLSDPSRVETEVLSAFPYEANEAVLHTDTGVLPRERRAWAAWNYLVPQGDHSRASVTYNMNLLQGLTSDTTYCVTLNDTSRIDPARILMQTTYHHPVFDMRRAAAQARHQELINRRNTSFCGAYWGNGFHEDGVVSALAVCRVLHLSSRQELRKHATATVAAD